MVNISSSGILLDDKTIELNDEGKAQIKGGVLFNVLGSDQTPGSISNSANETEVSEVNIPANEVLNGVLVLASGKSISTNFDAYQHKGTIRLRAGESGTATSNTNYKEIVRDYTNTSNSANYRSYVGWEIIYVITDLDWTNENNINITAQNNVADTGVISTCESLEVLKF